MRLTHGFKALAFACALAAALATSALASSGAPIVKAHTSAFGKILVDSRDHTLYLFERDKTTKSTCNGQCAKFWPPLLTTSKAKAGSGVTASMLGTTRRADGKLQVTYHGHPLYYFLKDTKAGQTAGQNLDFFGGEWYVLSPAGVKVEKKVSSGSSGGGGYGSSGSSDSSGSNSGGSGGYGYGG
jgi:predicted lipoprotein with Yx(FWY)xxD motif